MRSFAVESLTGLIRDIFGRTTAQRKSKDDEEEGEGEGEGEGEEKGGKGEKGDQGGGEKEGETGLTNTSSVSPTPSPTPTTPRKTKTRGGRTRGAGRRGGGEGIEMSSELQFKLVKSLEVLSSSPHRLIQAMSLQTLHFVLQSCGHATTSESWGAVFKMLLESSKSDDQQQVCVF